MATSRRRHQRHQGRTSSRHAFARRLLLEPLEDRRVLSVALSGVPDWIEQGPGPVSTVGINNFGVELQQAGAINGIAVDPDDANRMFVGTVNGGVWRTTTATYSVADSVDNDGDTLVDEADEFPHWEPLTDQLASTSMGDVAISRLDSNTIFAGFARFSSGFGDGGPRNGVIKSTDGGDTWAPVGENDELTGVNIQHILPTAIGTPATQVVLLGTNGGLFRSADGGNTWDLISGSDGSSDTVDNNDDGTVDEPGEVNLPSGGLTYLIGDPGNDNRFYAGLPTVGVLRSDDGGATWRNVTNNINTISPGVVASSTRLQLATHDSPGNNVVYVTVWPNGLAYAPGQGPGNTPNNPIQVFRSTDQGGTWVRLDDFPDVPDIRGPGGIAADPNEDNVLFMHGAQGRAAPDPIGNHGRVWRLDANAGAGTQWLRVTGVNAGGFGPHPDSRYMVFDRDGNLLDSDDGGLYRLVDPNNDNAARIWRSVNGDIRSIEFYSTAYDPLNNTALGGTQDDGSPRQRANGDPLYPFNWTEPQNCDGGIVAVDTDQTAHPGETIQYMSGQNLFACDFNRYTVDATNSATSVVVGAVVDGSTNGGPPANTLGPIEKTVPGGSTLPFITLYELNVAAPTRMIIGSAFLWESTNQGDNLTALAGLLDVNADGLNNDGDMATDEGDEFQPITPVGNLNTDGLDNDGAGRDDDNDGMIDEADEIDEGDEFAPVTAIAYGGRLNGANALDVLYIGKGARDGRGGLLNGVTGNLILRTVNATNTMADFTTLTNYPGTMPRDIVLDPDNWQIGYVIDINDNVYRFINAGAAAADWSLITGNLSSLFPATSIRTVELFTPSDIAGDDVLLVGGLGGVYRTLNPTAGPATIWTEFNNSGPVNQLPNMIVKDLRYTPPTAEGSPFPGDVLLAGTYGRGAWTIENASEVLLAAPVLNICGDEQHVNQDDTFRLVLNAGDPTMVDVFVNGAGPTTVSLATIQQINVFGVGGNDVLRVDSSFGLINVPTGIRYDGDGACPDSQPGFGYDRGFDTLILDQTGGDTQDIDVYEIGSTPGSGTITIIGDSGTQTVFFEELEPVIDLVPADFLSVVATPEANAINYNLAASGNGRVTVDNYEAIELANKDELVIDALAGDDVINLDNPLPAALGPTLIRVRAGAGDDVVTTRNLLDTNVRFIGDVGNDLLDASGITGAANLDGDAGDDVLIGSVGDDFFEGHDGNDVFRGGGGDDDFDGGAGFDTILILGTLANDTIDVNQTAAGAFTSKVNGNTSDETISSIEQVQIDARQGNDLVRVTTADDLPATSVQRYYVQGDAPNASDRLIVTDAGTGDLVIIHQAPDQRSGRVSVAPGAVNPPPEVVYEGIERLDILPIDPVTGGTGPDGDGQIKVFHSDPFEHNDNRLSAGQLARVPESATSPVVDPGGLTDPFGDDTSVPGDEDWYEFRPQDTGTFRVNILFDTLASVPSGRPGLPGNGDLNLDIYDANGVLIVSGVAAPGGKAAVFAATDDPAFPQFNRIFVRVRGATAGSINIYDFDNLSGVGTGNPGVEDVDIFGPQVTDVTINDLTTAEFNLFGLKPENASQGPTPLVESLLIHFQDLPPRAAGFLYPALETGLTPDEARGLFEVQGDHNGLIVIDSIIITNPFPAAVGETPTATIRLVFAQPLPDDRFTLTIHDSLRDPADNLLDGESNADEPNGAPQFPSGDGNAGGDFVTRFTVDTRPEIGAYALGTTYLDINGNTIWDPEGKDRDYTNRDIAFVFGFRDDRIFAGNFAPAGAGSASGFDKLGAFGNAGAGSAWRWRLDFNHDGVVDYDVPSGVNNSADPVAGNFSAAHPGDEVGLFNAGKWYLDSGGDNNVGGPGDTFLQGNIRGQPIVGDFDGDGLDDLGAWDGGNAGTQFDGFFQFDFASNGLTGNTDATIQFDLPGTFQKAIAADMNEDGIDDVGLFVSRREAVPPTEAAEWFFLISNVALKSTGTVNALNHPFTPVPFGNDIFAQFGDEAALPVVGNFDPPTRSPNMVGDHNPLIGLDVNNDGKISVFDALIVVNHLNASGGATAASSDILLAPFMDVNNDLRVSPHDALLVINHLNEQASGVPSGPEGEADSVVSSSSQVDDGLLSLLADDQEMLRRRRR